jgi:hypothetical protein
MGWQQNRWLLVCTGIAALLILPAGAHDWKYPDLNGWFQSLKSANKIVCCAGNDAEEIDRWESKDGNYRVYWRGTWHDVPPGAVVQGPNLVGPALLWINKETYVVRCFMPGVGG